MAVAVLTRCSSICRQSVQSEGETMFEHHRKTIDNLRKAFKGNEDYLGFIVNGSVARGDAGEGSDVDYYLVIDNDAFRALLEASPSIAIRLLEVLSRRLRVADERLSR